MFRSETPIEEGSFAEGAGGIMKMTWTTLLLGVAFAVSACNSDSKVVRSRAGDEATPVPSADAGKTDPSGASSSNSAANGGQGSPPATTGANSGANKAVNAGTNSGSTAGANSGANSASTAGANSATTSGANSATTDGSQKSTSETPAKSPIASQNARTSSNSLPVFSVGEIAILKKDCNDSSKSGVSCMQVAYGYKKQNDFKNAFEYYTLACTRGRYNVAGKCRDESKTYLGDARGCVEAATLASQIGQGESDVTSLVRCACEKSFQVSGKLGDCKKLTL